MDAEFVTPTTPKKPPKTPEKRVRASPMVSCFSSFVLEVKNLPRNRQYIIRCALLIQLRRSRPPEKFTETDLCQCAQKEGSTSRTWKHLNISSCQTTMCTTRQRTEKTSFTSPCYATKLATATSNDCHRR